MLYNRFRKLTVIIIMMLTVLFLSCEEQIVMKNDVRNVTQESNRFSSDSVTVNITIDGEASDWADIDTLTTASNQSATSLKVAHDNNCLYFCIEGTGMGPYYDLLINSDNNSATGYLHYQWTTSGCDYLVENGNLYVSTGSGWSWSFLGSDSLSVAANDTVIEISIKLGSFSNLAQVISVGFWDVNSSWEIKSILPTEGDLPLYYLEEQQNPPPSDSMKVLVPAYFYPGTEWNQLAQQALDMPDRLYAIANPNSGPGSTVDNNYVSAINNLRSNGGKVVGYVYTQYGRRNKKKVQKDIDKWYSYYSIDGIFLDEQANTSGKESYYQNLYNYIKSKDANAIILGNPGTSTIESYLYYNNERVTDLLCIYETGSGFLSWTAQSWTQSYSNSNFCVLPYNTDSTYYEQYVGHAVSQNVGWIYVTDDNLPNPWDTLPPYFESFCDYVTGY